jgi:quinol monooxygenase YgiN
MMICNVTIKAENRSREEVLEILSSVRGPVEGTPGCVRCRIYQDMQNNDLILYEEIWQEEEHLYQHIRSDLYLKILTAMDLSGEPPKVEFSVVSRTAGMELIREALGRVDPDEITRRRATLDRPGF